MATIVILAVVTGSAYALAALGLVLTYRVSGVFNFAHGAIGMFIAFCFWQFNSKWGISLVPALLLALLGVGGVLALIVERLYRPLKDESVAVQIVVSLGIMVFLTNLAIVFFSATPQRLRPIFPNGSVAVGDVRMGYDQIGAFLVALGCSLALGAFLWRSRLGLRMRAVVDNDSLSGLSGVSPVSVGRLAWLIATVFAGLGGILLSPLLGLDAHLLTLLVIATYAAAMFGRLQSLWLTWAGGLLLALGEHLIQRYASPSGALIGLRGSLSFFLLFGLLILFRRRLPTDRRAGRMRVEGGESRRASPAAALAALAVIAIMLPLVISDQQLFNVNGVVVTAVILTSLVVLTGFSGQVSLCQASFVGIGAFAAGHVIGTGAGSLLWALVLAVLIAAPVGALVGLPSLRLSGLFLALATMSFGLLMDNLVFNVQEIAGAQGGIGVESPSVAGASLASSRAFYVLALAVFGAFALLATALRRGRLGRRLRAMADSPVALQTLGVNLATTKLFVFALSASMAAVGGVLFGMYSAQVSRSDFTMFFSVGFLIAAVIGGIDTVRGALLGGLILTFPQFILTTQQVGAKFNDLFALGIGGLVIMIARYPNGLVSMMSQQARSVLPVLRPSPPAPGASRAAPTEPLPMMGGGR